MTAWTRTYVIWWALGLVPSFVWIFAAYTLDVSDYHRVYVSGSLNVATIWFAMWRANLAQAAPPKTPLNSPVGPDPSNTQAQKTGEGS